MKLPQIDSERVLLLLFLGLGGIWFVESYSFGSTAGLFPRMTSAVVIVGSVLLLFRDYLPKRINTYVAEPVDVFGTTDIEAETQEVIEGNELDDQSEETTQSEHPEESRLISDTLFSSISIVAYFVTSLLFGMLWMSPLFAFVYSSWSRHSWSARIGLTAVAFVLAYAFMVVLNLDLANGLLVDSGIGTGGL